MMKRGRIMSGDEFLEYLDETDEESTPDVMTEDFDNHVMIEFIANSMGWRRGDMAHLPIQKASNFIDAGVAVRVG